MGDTISPMIINTRYEDNTVETGLGACLVINKEGWVMTAAHNVTGLFFESPGFKSGNGKKILNHSVWLVADGVGIQQIHYHPENDLALLKIDEKFISRIKVFPRLKNPNLLTPGTSLCKLGFPFHNLKKADFNEKSGMFEFSTPPLPIPIFPIEGIHTRNIYMGKTADQKLDIMFLETSSPGLKGQSGGPVFDREGNICGIQSQNTTMPLGFVGIGETIDGRIQEHQFINVGWAVHLTSILEILAMHKVKMSKE